MCYNNRAAAGLKLRLFEQVGGASADLWVKGWGMRCLRGGAALQPCSTATTVRSKAHTTALHGSNRSKQHHSSGTSLMPFCTCAAALPVPSWPARRRRWYTTPSVRCAC